MLKSGKGFASLLAALQLAVLGSGSVERRESSINSHKRATPRPDNLEAGSKLARKAAKGRLTGNPVSRYGQGLNNHFAARRGRLA